jgi:hypothetical protein
MSKIQINNLQATGSELFEGEESFLTELQATEAHTIFGGGSKKKKNKYGGGETVFIFAQPQQPIFTPVFVPFPTYSPFPAGGPRFPGYPYNCF